MRCQQCVKGAAVLAEQNPLTGLEPPHLHIYHNLSGTNRMFCRNGCRQEKLHTQSGEAAAERQRVVAQNNRKKKKERKKCTEMSG